MVLRSEQHQLFVPAKRLQVLLDMGVLRDVDEAFNLSAAGSHCQLLINVAIATSLVTIQYRFVMRMDSVDCTVHALVLDANWNIAFARAILTRFMKREPMTWQGGSLDQLGRIYSACQAQRMQV